MDIVRIRRYKTDVDTTQYSMSIPVDIGRKLSDASKMLMEHDPDTGKILCTPVN